MVVPGNLVPGIVISCVVLGDPEDILRDTRPR